LTLMLQALQAALYSSVRKYLQDAQLATAEMSFAWRAFNFDSTTVNPLGLPYGHTTSRPSELVHHPNSQLVIHFHSSSFSLYCDHFALFLEVY